MFSCRIRGMRKDYWISIYPYLYDGHLAFFLAEFEDDPDLYVLKPVKYVGIEVWQVGLQLAHNIFPD